MPNNTESFHEVQRLPLRRSAIALAVPPTAMAAILLWQVLLGHGWGKYSISNRNVIGWTIFLWIVYFRLLTVRIVTDVNNHEIVVALKGLWRKFRVPAADISSVDVITLDAERDYGGYGVRSIRTGTAYAAQSGEGVRIHLAKGSLLIVSSRKGSHAGGNPAAYRQGVGG